MSTELRSRVQAAVRELGYEVDLIGSSLRSGLTKSVGLLVNDIANSLFAEITIGAEGALKEAGYSLLLMSSDGVALRDEAAIRLFRSRRVDGLILAHSDETDAGVNRLLSDFGSPIVLLDRQVPVDSPAVLTDHFTGMRAAVNHLIGMGHRRTAILVGPTATRPGRCRIDAFIAAHSERELKVSPRHIVSVPSPSADAGERACERLFDQFDEKRPTAIVVGGHQLMIGVLRFLRKRGMAIPGDLSVVSCDETPLCELHTPGITALHRDTVETGRQAACLVLEQITNPGGRPKSVVMPTDLIVRGSTAPPRVTSR